MSKISAPIVDDAQDLELEAIIGFDGRTTHALRAHPNGKHVLYPLGCKVAIVDWETKKQEFLEGHTNIITAVDVSRCGKYVGSGQINHMGFKALVILWDFEKRKALLKHDVHKVRVESLVFSKDSIFLYSLGGRDDENIVATHIPTLEPMCGYPAPNARAGNALTVIACNRRDLSFITAGENTLRIWHVDPVRRNVRPTDVGFNKLKRDIFCVALDWRDEWAYCGTLTGDILKAKLNFPEDDRLYELERPPLVSLALGKIPKKANPICVTDNYSKGVRDILVMDDAFGRHLIVGAGDGTVEMVVETDPPPPPKSVKLKTQKLKTPSQPRLTPVHTANVFSAVTTLQFFHKPERQSCGIIGSSVLVGTELCEIYLIDIATFNTKLLITCHTTTIYDLCFPKATSEVFVTAGKDDIRVWNTASCKELLRIAVPNFTCTAVKFMDNGSAIVSGWNDGCIRAFTPQTGHLVWTIRNGHNKGVSALDVTSCGRRVVSGGGEGQVRVWELHATHQDLAAIMKDHKGPVSAIHINCDNTQAVSASTDGSCIIWDLIRNVRWQILFANSLFMACKYNPEGCQVLTAGTDRKVQYWEVYDGSMIREFDASVSAAINSLDISADGRHFVTGSNDCLVKVWNYDEGFTTHIGVGHAGIITSVRFSLDYKYIISVSDDGAIFIWLCPFEEEARAPRPASVGSRSTCSLRSIAFRMAGEGFDRPNSTLPLIQESAGGDSCALENRPRRSSDESSRRSTPTARESDPVCVSRGSTESAGSRRSCVPPGQIARESRGCNVTEIESKDKKTPSRASSSRTAVGKSPIEKGKPGSAQMKSSSSSQRLQSRSIGSISREQSIDNNKRASRQGSIKPEPVEPSKEVSGVSQNKAIYEDNSSSDSEIDVTS